MTKLSKKVITFGCRLNNLESELINQQLNQHSIDKNTFIFNTCAVTSEAERKARQSIRKIKKENPNAKIVVTGCSAQIDPNKWLQMEEVSNVIGNSEKTKKEFWKNFSLNQKNEMIASDIMLVREDKTDFSGLVNQNSRYFLQIQNGCDHRCTFCVIPYGRGNSRSVSVNKILENVNEALQNNFKEIVLTGVDLTSWGKELLGEEYSLGFLVKKILNEFKILPRLRVSSIDPAEIDYELMEVLEYDDRFMPHLHLSIQHGDDLILKRMKRRHLYRDVINLVNEARRRRPEITFGADIISGFPTETSQAHRNTLKLIKEANINFVHAFPFSPREGTPAAKMKMLSNEIINKRAKEVRELGHRNKIKYFKSIINYHKKVLIEEGNKGYTECFSRVHLNEKLSPGSLVDVKIISSNKNHLEGVLL
ncbi:MAG: tRNA (N(6)-L-threonylcarbamoyladenosine(37)-C(2))-methylthiotransferase MtaB [Candidatus Puniceispirillales bacterium]